MDYDWIGKVLNIIVQDDDEFKIIQVVVNDGDVREINQTDITEYLSDATEGNNPYILRIIANPFTRLACIQTYNGYNFYTY